MRAAGMSWFNSTKVGDYYDLVTSTPSYSLWDSAGTGLGMLDVVDRCVKRMSHDPPAGEETRQTPPATHGWVWGESSGPITTASYHQKTPPLCSSTLRLEMCGQVGVSLVQYKISNDAR